MRNLILSIIFLCCATAVVAQVNEPDSVQTHRVTEILVVDDSESADGQSTLEAFMLDEQPQFPGGIDGLMNFLMQNVTYPAECAEAEIQGKVMVKFVVQKDGTIGDVEITKSVHPILDAEAIRVVKSMPKWTPGILGGSPVNVWYSLPVNFKLQGNSFSTPTLSERDQTDFDNFIRLGDEALAAGNNYHAYQYYKECFNIKPWEFSLIDKIDNLLSCQIESQEQFYRWAIARMHRECEKNWGASDDYIANMIKLQEKLVEKHPNDLSTLGAMEFLYFQGFDFDNVIATANKIYPLIPKDEVNTFANALKMDTNARIYKKDYNGVINLVAPHIDNLLTQKGEYIQYAPFFELVEAYLNLDKKSEAKEILSKVKATYSDSFNELIPIYCEDFPEYATTIQELIK